MDKTQRELLRAIVFISFFIALGILGTYLGGPTCFDCTPRITIFLRWIHLLMYGAA